MRHPLAALWLCCAASAVADTIIIPSRAATIGGNGSFTVLLSDSPHSYMCAIGAAELNNRLPIGAFITGISFRMASWQPHASWPPAAASFDSFDIYLARAARSPGMLSLANPMTNAGKDLTLVRSGPIDITPAYFPGGAITPAFNAFPTPIKFEKPYLFTGGELLLLIRHTGANAPAGSLDWVPSLYAGSGAQAIAIDSYTQNTNWSLLANAGCIAVCFTFVEPPPPPSPCYPNCDQSTLEPILNIADFSCFLALFAAGDPAANCDESTADPVLNVADFACFLGAFAAGCK